MKPEEKIWWSVPELAAEWDVEEGWIRDHATRKQPRIRAHKFGKFLRFHRDDIREFLRRIAREAA